MPGSPEVASRRERSAVAMVAGAGASGGLVAWAVRARKAVVRRVVSCIVAVVQRVYWVSEWTGLVVVVKEIGWKGGCVMLPI